MRTDSERAHEAETEIVAMRCRRDVLKANRDAWRECAVRLANGLIYGLNEHAEAARSRYIAGDGPSLTCGCALCERYRLILAAFDELKEKDNPTPQPEEAT